MNEMTSERLRKEAVCPRGCRECDNYRKYAAAWEADREMLASVGSMLDGALAQVGELAARIEALETALRQCERALRMPWLNTYEESAQALALIDRALSGEEMTNGNSRS